MKRRNFLGMLALGSGAAITPPALAKAIPGTAQAKKKKKVQTLTASLVIAGGGLGGVAAALAALHSHQTVILTEETDWIGGQLTQQGVPPDEHPWIETHGAPARYRELRNRIREYYIRNYPLTADAKQRSYLNPGDGSVSRLCHEPRVALSVMQDMLAPFISNGTLTLLTQHKVVRANVSGNKVQSLVAVNLQTGDELLLQAPYFSDATEMGDLLPLTGTEFVTGTESKKDTGELHAPEKADPENNQSFTVCFAIDYVPGADHTIDKPEEYEFWRKYIPALTPAWSGRQLDLHYSDPRTLKPKQLGFHPEGIKTGELLNLWNYRRIIHKTNFEPGTYAGDITIVNWPQNDYMLGNLVGATPAQFRHHVARAGQLNLSLLYWLQTEAPRPDGGKGWPGIRLRKDIMGTPDGMAKYPYIRESRRIKAVFTVLEEHVGAEQRALKTGQDKDVKAATFHDSVGIGYYHIDLHPGCNGTNYVDFASLPFQIPLGALLPRRMENLLPANKNIGTTHITNGCFRLHPVEWSIGEAVGLLVAFAHSKNVLPKQVREQAELLKTFQEYIRERGVETEWK